LVPARKQPGLKAGAFSPAWLVPVAETEINELYKPGLKAFFPPVQECTMWRAAEKGRKVMETQPKVNDQEYVSVSQ
jgi:hypothetical protein